MRLCSRLGPAFAVGAVVLIAATADIRADAVFGATDDFEGAHSWEGHTETVPCQFCAFPLDTLCLCPPESEQQGASIQGGGLLGLGDDFLQLSPLPSFGIEAWNRASNRTGDYNTAGIADVGANLKNFGSSALQMRVGLERGPTRWVTSNAAAVTVAPSSGWTYGTFALDEAQMTRVAGSDPLSWVLDRVEEVRFLHAASAQWSGDSGSIAGVDNVVLPEPTAGAGLAAGTALLVGLARRRRWASRGR